MPIKTRASTKQRPQEADDDEHARFEAWLNDFDARHAGLSAKLDALLHSLGVDPARTSKRETA